MANFLIVVDADGIRRARFLRAVEPRLAPVAGLKLDRAGSGDFGAVWAANPHAPISSAADANGVTVLWGDAVPRSSLQSVDARELRTVWNVLPEEMPDPLDGFHAAVMYRPWQGVVVGCDLLGLFPVYYYATPDILLVGSSPELFHHHPSFHAELNAAGLVGVLLTMHLVGGETLLRGVKRLTPGHLLCWEPGEAAQERMQYRLPLSTDSWDLPLEAHIRSLDSALDFAVTRHMTVGTRHSLLLSGGMDSRMLGGFIKRQGRNDTLAVTFGRDSDLDMKCGAMVADVLGFPHHPIDVADDHHPEYAQLQAHWEHLANGFNTVADWGALESLSTIGPRVLTGYLGDAVLGGSHIPKSYAPSEGTFSFKTYFAQLNNWAIRPKTLKKLLRREIFGNLVDETISRLEADYEQGAAHPSHRAWRAHLQQRQRFHVGGALWRLSFAAWPVQPHLDQKVLEVVGAMPVASLGERRLQVGLICQRFPELAQIPLDSNQARAFPIQPRFRWMLGWYGYGRAWDALRRKFERVDRRYYVRTYDFNGDGWRAVRRESEQCRARVQHLFNLDVLNEILPPAETSISYTDGLAESSGAKVLLGLLLWSKDRV